jgi:DNA-binding transcriptional regulator LsrR (DeoR family)
MSPSGKKIERLIEVAQLYYEQDMTQSQIAKRLGISRPLVSVLLAEARSTGVVSIKINHADTAEQLLAKRVENRFGLREVIVIPDRKSADLTDGAVAAAAFDFCFRQGKEAKSVGVGWGSMLGRIADYAETLDAGETTGGSICPLIGGIGASYRGYHTNEIARIISVKAGLDADYFYMPAFFDSETELEFARRMEAFLALNEKWEHMDLALVSVSNYPSYPDLGVEYRYGNRLTRENAVGRVLAHYYNIKGVIIEPDVQNVLQASVEQLRTSRSVIAVCSTLLRPQSLIGAVSAGFIDTLMLAETLATQVLEI